MGVILSVGVSREEKLSDDIIPKLEDYGDRVLLPRPVVILYYC